MNIIKVIIVKSNIYFLCSKILFKEYIWTRGSEKAEEEGKENSTFNILVCKIAPIEKTRKSTKYRDILSPIFPKILTQ